MARGRWKQRGLYECGYKLDKHTPSEDLCPYCFSFGCDPMAMSPRFHHKIHERLRMCLCPCCGKPIAHCSCKSSAKIAAGAHTITTHNNKKLTKAKQIVLKKERAYQVWLRDRDLICSVMGTELYGRILDALYHHKTPEVTYESLYKKFARAHLDFSIYADGWE